MAGRLAQPQQRFEHLDLRLARVPSRAMRPSSARAVVVAQLVVELRRCGVPGRSRSSARSSRAGLGDLLLGAPQNERPQRLRQDATLRLLAGLRRWRRLEDRRAVPSMPGIEELEQAPQLAQMILDRRAAQRQAMIGLEQPRGLGRPRAGVLDRLGFVEDE